MSNLETADFKIYFPFSISGTSYALKSLLHNLMRWQKSRKNVLRKRHNARFFYIRSKVPIEQQDGREQEINDGQKKAINVLLITYETHSLKSLAAGLRFRGCEFNIVTAESAKKLRPLVLPLFVTEIESLRDASVTFLTYI